MSKAENSFIAGVHRYLSDVLYAEKMANPYRGGTPDVWYSGHLRDLWVEYKFIVLPKRPGTVIVPDLSPLQFEWLKNRQADGRNVLVAIGCKEGAYLFRTPEQWRSGVTTRDFRDNILSRSSLAQSIVTFCGHSIIPKAHQPKSSSNPRPSPCAPTKAGSSPHSKLLSKPQKNLSTASPSSTVLRSVNTRRPRIGSPTT